MTENANVEVSAEMEQFISYVEKLSVLELSKLVKALEDRLGVSAAAPVAVAAAAPAADWFRPPLRASAWPKLRIETAVGRPDGYSAAIPHATKSVLRRKEPVPSA